MGKGALKGAVQGAQDGMLSGMVMGGIGGAMNPSFCFVAGTAAAIYYGGPVVISALGTFLSSLGGAPIPVH